MYDSLEEIVSVCENENISFPDLIIREDAADADITVEEEVSKMNVMWQAILNGARNYEETGLTFRPTGKLILLSAVIIWAELYRQL